MKLNATTYTKFRRPTQNLDDLTQNFDDLHKFRRPYTKFRQTTQNLDELYKI